MQKGPRATSSVALASFSAIVLVIVLAVGFLDPAYLVDRFERSLLIQVAAVLASTAALLFIDAFIGRRRARRAKLRGFDVILRR